VKEFLVKNQKKIASKLEIFYAQSVILLIKFPIKKLYFFVIIFSKNKTNIFSLIKSAISNLISKI